MSKKSKKSEETTVNPAIPDPKKVVAGPAVVEQTVNAQAKEARGEDEKAKDNGGDASLRPKTFPNEDALKHRDETKEARVQALKDLGIDPEAPYSDGVHKVEPAEGQHKEMYSGVVTMTGYSREYKQKVSQRIDIGSAPRGWGWCEYAFRAHMGPNCVLEKIDPENVDDPLLRTIHG